MKDRLEREREREWGEWERDKKKKREREKERDRWQWESERERVKMKEIEKSTLEVCRKWPKFEESFIWTCFISSSRCDYKMWKV